MKGLPLFHYGAIYADPPWSYENWSKAGAHKNAAAHYDCLSVADIAALPVGQFAAPDCALFLWVTDPTLPQGLEVMRAWGFQFKTVAFTWAKQTKTATKWHLGCGYWTRANPEMCLLGTMGRPKRLARDVRQLVVAPVREHSRKPDGVRGSIERLVAGPYLELFARQKAPGWDAWGNEVGKFDDVEKAAREAAKGG
jgi:N6-adenosine-specific RNA methylase IME4